MIQLSNKTTVALLIALCKKNYGQAWYSDVDREGFFAVGLHLPTGEVAYYVPEEYKEYFKGMILQNEPDLLSTASQNDSADRLLEWSKTL